jgi:hypothetical protein
MFRAWAHPQGNQGGFVFAHVRKHPTILPTERTPQISLKDRARMNASAIDCADPPLEDLEIEATTSVLFWPTESDPTSPSRHENQGEIGSHQSTESKRP